MSIYESISDRLLYDFPQRQTKVGVIFGSKSVSGELARAAGRLWKNGAFEDIIITGGNPVREPIVATALSLNFIGVLNPPLQFPGWSDFFSRKTEAEYTRNILVEEYQIPEASIKLCETQSTNTGENVENIKDLLSQYESATLISTAYFQRRVMGTIRKNSELSDLILVSSAVYPWGFNRDNWYETPIKAQVFEEASHMDQESDKTYIGKFCCDPNIETEIERAMTLPAYE